MSSIVIAMAFLSTAGFGCDVSEFYRARIDTGLSQPDARRVAKTFRKEHGLASEFLKNVDLVSLGIDERNRLFADYGSYLLNKSVDYRLYDVMETMLKLGVKPASSQHSALSTYLVIANNRDLKAMSIVKKYLDVNSEVEIEEYNTVLKAIQCLESE